MLHFCAGEPTDDGIIPSRGRGLQKTGMTLCQRHMETVRMSQKRKTGDRLGEAWEQEGYWIDCITACLWVEILRRIKMGQPKFTKQWLEYVATSIKPNDDTWWWTVNYYMFYYPVSSLVFCLWFLISPLLSPSFLKCCLTLCLKPNFCFWGVWQAFFFPTWGFQETKCCKTTTN